MLMGNTDAGPAASSCGLRPCIYLQGILNLIDCGVFVLENGQVTVFNRAAEKLTGIKAGEVVGRDINEVCRRHAICRDLFNGSRAVRGQLKGPGGLPLQVDRTFVAGALVVTLQNAETPRRTRSHGLEAKFRFSDIVGHSAMIQETIREARKYAHSEATVLITGESGTGKELFAQSIHNESSRREGPFVAVNCAALPENLLESELFGYEEGAFTGARRGGKPGLFTLAHGGTIFLDEISELSPALQARLLRVLQEKQVMPVGGQRVYPVDVRIISATNQDLKKLVKEGRFRKDLYFRLNVLNLHIPPLRDRLEDVPALFRHFLGRLAGTSNLDLPRAEDNWPHLLKNYLWPGNVRELEGFAARYAALGEEDVSTRATFRKLFNKLTGLEVPVETAHKKKIVIELGNMNEMEKQIIIEAQKIIRGGKSELAKVLGVSRTTLWKKLRELDDEYRRAAGFGNRKD